MLLHCWLDESSSSRFRPLLKPFCVFSVKEEYVSEAEEEPEEGTLAYEILQHRGTAVIYPLAPQDEQSPAETGGADENGNRTRTPTPLARFFSAFPEPLG